MKKVFLLLLVLSFSYFIKAQDSQYFYTRNQGESAEQFVNKYYNPDDYAYAHGVIEGDWGDESKGEKIMVILDSPIIDEYDRSTLLIFQPVGDGKNYILIPVNGLGEVGIYMSGVESMFFYDMDDDGSKELFIIEHGELRVDTVIEEEDENGKMIEYHTTACCEDIYETTIFKQKRKFTNGYLPLVESFAYDDEYLDLSGLETAGEIKNKIKDFKNKE